MLLTFTETTIDGHRKNYSWWFPSIETVLDVLSLLTAKGRKVVQAELIDNGQRTQLSVDAFDGNGLGFSGAFQQLEHQWQCILAETAQTPSIEPIDR